MATTAPAKSRDTATLRAYHWEAYNEIVQPSRIDVYLVDKWLPSLGPLGFALVKALRRRCYHNPKSGETRNEIEVDMTEIAHAVGVHIATVYREFERNESLKQFVQIQSQYAATAPGKAPKRYKPMVIVAMDEPVHPTDMERYDCLRVQKEADRVARNEELAQGTKFRFKGKPADAAATGSNSPNSQNATKGKTGSSNADLPNSQNATKGGTNSQIAKPESQNANPESQFATDPPYISSSPSSLLVSLHAEDGASPHINSPQGEEADAFGGADGGETFDPLLAAWNVALGLLASKINKPTMETHMRLLRLVSFSPTGEVTLAAPSAFSRDWVMKRHTEDVGAALAEALGEAMVTVQIVVQAK